MNPRYEQNRQIRSYIGRLVLIFLWMGWMPGLGAESRPSYEIVITPNVASGIAFVGEVVDYQITVQNRMEPKRDAELIVSIQAPGQEARLERWNLSLESGGKIEKTLSLPTTSRGYWSLLVTLRSDGRLLARRESALAVVEKLPNYGRMDARSFFGTMFNRDPEAAQRIGIKCERQQAVWEWLSPAESAYTWEKLDARVTELRKHGIGVVLVIRPEIPPKWAKWKSVEELSKPELLPYFQKFTKDVVERYRGQVAAIEVVNEPDLECARKASGKVPIPHIYAILLKTAYETIKGIAPELPVIGLDVSGVDFPHLGFSQATLAEVPAAMNIMGGHPYTGSRYLGSDAKAESPDAIQTAGRFAAMAELMKKHGLKPRIWSTEFGWGLHKDEPLTSPSTELLAAYLAQAMAMARSVPEVEKLFWFSMFFPGYEGGFTYGMFHGNPPNSYPTPGAAAYATCARFLDDVRFVRAFPLGDFGKVLRFADQRNGEGIFLLWLSEPKSVGGEILMALTEKNLNILEINDGYGRAITGDWVVRALPLYVRVAGIEADRLEKAIRSAPQQARETLLIEHAYLTDVSLLNVDVVNNSGESCSVKLFPKDKPDLAKSRKLPMGSSMVTLSLSAPLAGKGEIPLELLQEASGKKITFLYTYDLTPIAKLAPVKIDGRLDEITGLKSLVLENREAVSPHDPGVDWNGPKDLSMEVWTGWTLEGLYLAVKVTDDIATEASTKEAQFWQKDSLQIGWDMGSRADSGYDSRCVELGVFRTATGTGVYQTYPDSRARDDVAVSSRREEGVTIYEMSVPWSALNFPDAANGRVFRMNLIANDNDGRGRKCWIGLTPGIGEGKRPAAFRQWVLAPSSSSPFTLTKTPPEATRGAGGTQSRAAQSSP